MLLLASSPELEEFLLLMWVRPLIAVLDRVFACSPLAGNRASASDRRVDVSSVVSTMSTECSNVGRESLKAINSDACCVGVTTNRMTYYHISMLGGVL
jgi:hypothetical protein